MTAHFYHVYAAGDWPGIVTEHCNALVNYGLYDELDSFQVGFVGSAADGAAVRCTLDVLTPKYEVCAQAETGWEQVTLNPMFEYAQTHDGPIVYAHTKGASRRNPIDTPWRRMMEYHCIVDWRRPVAELEAGKAAAGCYWVAGGPSSIPGNGTGGMFGGNYFWTTCELLRQNVPPDNTSRHAAEHWLGQLSEVVPFTNETLCNLVALPIGDNPPPF